jgi:hypothetical protein
LMCILASLPIIHPMAGFVDSIDPKCELSVKVLAVRHSLPETW